MTELYTTDRWLLLSAMCLLALGLLMVASASMVISDRIYGQPFHYLFRQTVYLGAGAVLILALVQMPMRIWEQYSIPLFFLGILLLIMVLVPGVGHTVNGSSRWINLGFTRLQVSELVKLFTVMYMAGYLVRRQREVRTEISGFIKPMVLLGIVSVLLLKQPDFGATTVIMLTAMGMLFLAGVRWWQFAALLALVALAMGVLAVSSPYRMARLTAFLNPWANQFDSGYQLTQSLIAFGRGGWLGVGLGASIQKLFYLPEAHTDFLFAVLVEELGLAGAVAVIGLFACLVGRGLAVGRRAMQLNNVFSGYVAYGLSLWLGLQAMINIGVNSGMLPTKGLTLPLMSYGGSSLLVNCMALAVLLRIDYENRIT